MTISDDAPHDTLTPFGFTPRQATALRLIWNSPALDNLLNDVALAIIEQHGSPEDALDFIKHAHDASATGFYYHHGLTAHQAHIIDADPKAHTNLWDRPTGGADDLLDHPAPRTFMINVLRTATSPEDVDRYLRRYQQALDGTPQGSNNEAVTTADLEAEAETQAAAQPYVGVTCDCAYL